MLPKVVPNSLGSTLSIAVFIPAVISSLTPTQSTVSKAEPSAWNNLPANPTNVGIVLARSMLSIAPLRTSPSVSPSANQVSSSSIAPPRKSIPAANV